MTRHQIQELLSSAGSVRSACDLDLLIFLWRHPRSILTTDRLARLTGTTAAQIGSALDLFLERGLLERALHPSHSARLFVLQLQGPSGEATRRLLRLASDADGRREVLRALDTEAGRPEEGTQRVPQTLRVLRARQVRSKGAR